MCTLSVVTSNLTNEYLVQHYIKQHSMVIGIVYDTKSSHITTQANIQHTCRLQRMDIPSSMCYEHCTCILRKCLHADLERQDILFHIYMSVK